MDRFLAIESFVRVAETESFAEAARQMRVSRSVVTARIQQLEAFVGAPLFHRNTRSVRLSELGQAFLRDCTELVGRTNEVVDQMREVTTSPVGRLRVHALPGFVLGHLARVLQVFQARYPQIVLDMIVNDAAIDPVKEGFDCALQIFPPRSEELISRKLFPVRRVFCASPEYVRRHGLPRHPRDLMGHRIGWYSGYPTRERLAFHGAGGTVSLELKPVLLTNSVHLLREYALEHAGIVCIPTLVASESVLSGALRLVLPDHPLSAFWLSVFYPESVRSSLKLKLFLEVLATSFSGLPPWDEALIERGLLAPDIIE
ncbi:LysR family transcriptional regulator [Piscinibacter sakaiensis]|uniref:Transcriptional regulator, LysR family n=1 Tax=Piscinibacter sakaiensis TaxID=1547922 RepID=A0A0K8P0K4_PISS1|nr:LysR family transcriptional regulator [Piscinibacter sakaiensis]GAP36182.1 transcriptional regulator, LysR family [Piscinibacter sakaiensis]